MPPQAEFPREACPWRPHARRSKPDRAVLIAAVCQSERPVGLWFNGKKKNEHGERFCKKPVPIVILIQVQCEPLIVIPAAFRLIVSIVTRLLSSASSLSRRFRMAGPSLPAARNCCSGGCSSTQHRSPTVSSSDCLVVDLPERRHAECPPVIPNARQTVFSKQQAFNF